MAITSKKARYKYHGLWGWVRGWLAGGPHFVIGDSYVLRWYIWPRNKWLNLYLHKFQHDDDDRALHDHPWWFISWMLKGSYVEIVQSPPAGWPAIARGWLSIAFRPATHAHRVVLPRDSEGQPIPCWTLILTGPVIREWGFWCPKGWRSWREYTAGVEDYGQTGRGCE